MVSSYAYAYDDLHIDLRYMFDGAHSLGPISNSQQRSGLPVRGQSDTLSIVPLTFHMFSAGQSFSDPRGKFGRLEACMWSCVRTRVRLACCIHQLDLLSALGKWPYHLLRLIPTSP
jgi:hypothetical protein